MPHRNLPAVIVVASGTLAPLEGDSPPVPGAVVPADALSGTLAQVLATQMPLLVVTPADLVPVAARSVASRDILVIPPAGEPAQGAGTALAAAVSQQADAAGWIILPAGCAGARSGTLRQIADALRQHPVAYAQRQGRRVYPVGFSSGLFSDLMALAVDEGPRRLAARFPGYAVELDEAPVSAERPASTVAPAMHAAAVGSASAA